MSRRLRAAFVALAAVTVAAGAFAALAALAISADAPLARADEPRDAQGYRLARPPYVFQFPRDFASHPDSRTEWWYTTGHLAGAGGRYGFEVTFFRFGIDPARALDASAWAPHTVWFAHVALTDESRGTFAYGEEASRPALGMAGGDSLRERVWVHADTLALLADGRTHRLVATLPGTGSLALVLVPLKPPVVHGDRGVSWKSAHDASHYFSLTRLAVHGALAARGRTSPVSGQAWMDHEFFSDQDTALAGWDWFSVQLDDGRELMLYRLRHRDGALEPASSGTWVERDGRTRHLAVNEVTVAARGSWRSPATSARYPSGWRIAVPGADTELTLEPTVPDQELVTRATGVIYWEGSVRVRGTARGRPVTGVGYVELTGYAGTARVR